MDKVWQAVSARSALVLLRDWVTGQEVFPKWETAALAILATEVAVALAPTQTAQITCSKSTLPLVNCEAKCPLWTPLCSLNHVNEHLLILANLIRFPSNLNHKIPIVKRSCPSSSCRHRRLNCRWYYWPLTCCRNISHVLKTQESKTYHHATAITSVISSSSYAVGSKSASRVGEKELLMSTAAKATERARTKWFQSSGSFTFPRYILNPQNI